MNTISECEFLPILDKIIANGYPRSKHIIVEINDNRRDSDKAFMCSGVVIDIMLLKVNAPVLSVSP